MPLNDVSSLTKQCISVGDSPGLVFLQYRNETKRALLPNEITSIDTVKALFVRSFPKQLTMEYLDSPHVKVYIHDSNKDMFYELEDLRYDSLISRFFFYPSSLYSSFGAFEAFEGNASRYLRSSVPSVSTIR
jgi:hypothetical protein